MLFYLLCLIYCLTELSCLIFYSALRVIKISALLTFHNKKHNANDFFKGLPDENCFTVGCLLNDCEVDCLINALDDMSSLASEIIVHGNSYLKNSLSCASKRE